MTSLLKQYSCPECGANETSRAFDCCDFCIIKIFLNDPEAPAYVVEVK